MIRSLVIRSLSGLALLAIAVAAPVHAQTLPFTYETLAALNNGAGYVDMKRDASGRAHMTYYDNAAQQLKYTYRSGSSYVTEIITGDGSGPHALALDPQGRPCIAYSLRSPGGLNLMTRTGPNTWTTQVITTTATTNPDLAFNYSGKAAVTFRNTVTSRLQYSERPVNGSWSVPYTPDNATALGLYSALALNYAGDPRIIYRYSNTNLKYTERNGATWTFAVLANHDVSAVDIALTSIEEPRVVAFANNSGAVEYYQRVGASWSSATTIENVGASGLFVNTRIVVDGSDNPRVSYHKITAQSLRYASRSGTTWTLYDVDTSFPNTGTGNSLALDASGNPLLAYSSGTPPSLKFAHAGVELYQPNGGETYPQYYRPYVYWGGNGTFSVDASEDDGITWSPQVSGVTGNSAYNQLFSLDTPPFISAQCRLRMTRTSTPTGTAQSYGPFRITPGMNRPWLFGTVDNAGVVGYRPSIATDGTTTGISYYDSTNADLKFASRCLDGPWTVETVQSAGSAGLQSATKIVNGTVYVLYTDQTANLVTLATRSYGSWSFETVYTGTAYSPSIAVQSNGVVHVAFWAANEIKYGFKNAGSWVIESVGTANLSGECSIALTSTNAPRIAYWSFFFSPQTGPRYGIRLGANSWTYETMESGPADAYGICLTHNSSDLARVSYINDYNSASKKVRVAFKQTTGWTVSSIRTTGSDMGLFTSLAVNASDQIYLVYWSHGMFQYYGPGTSGSTYYSDLGSTPMGYGRASIVLTPSGDPTIAFYDMLHGDLEVFTDLHDLVPPAAPVTSASLSSNGSVVSWYDTGDDDMTCNATYFEVREYFSPINSEVEWANASVIASGAPGIPWTSHCIDVATGPCSPYWFAARMQDNAGHWSAWNTSGGTTPCSGHSFPICDQVSLYKKAPEGGPDAPVAVEMGSPAPNPIRDQMSIRLGIPTSHAGENVEVAVFDVVGRRVATLQHGALAPGWHVIRWDRRGSTGHTVERGMYYLRMSVGGETKVRSMLVLGR